MASKQGMYILGFLFVVLMVSIFTDPRVKGFLNTRRSSQPPPSVEVAPPSPPPPSLEELAPAPPAAQLPSQQPPPSSVVPSLPAVSDLSSSVTPATPAVSIPEDIVVLPEQLGRPDPFEPIHAAETSDEMLPPPITLPPIAPLPPVQQKPIPALQLTAISFQGGVGIAIINGNFIKVGEFVESLKLISIGSESVTLKTDTGEIVTIRLGEETGGAPSEGETSIIIN